MIRKFEHGILCLRDDDKFVVNIVANIYSPYRLAIANIENQVFVKSNPLLAPRALADWRYS